MKWRDSSSTVKYEPQTNERLRFSSRQLGILDAIDGWKPIPSAVDHIDTDQKRVEYLDGYLYGCTPGTQPDHALSARHLLALYSPEQAEAEATSARLIEALWRVANDELYQDALDVDAAQSERTDWRN